jgi:hypothetical protein
MVGLVGLEPTTPALSRRCSNQLSYRPALSLTPLNRHNEQVLHPWRTARRPPNPSQGRQPARSRFVYTHCCSKLPADKCERTAHEKLFISRKEVIQPHLPIRLPCYDFTPVTNPAVVIAPLAVKLTTSGRTRSHGVTGGVYKTRERIHRGKLIRDY